MNSVLQDTGLHGLPERKRDMRQFDKLFTIFVFFLSAGAVFYASPEETDAFYLHGNTQLQIIWSGVYFITGCFLLLDKNRAFLFASHDPLLWLLLGMALLSVLWSLSPASTLQRGAALSGTTAFGLFVATRFQPSTVWSFLLGTLGVIAVLSLIYVFLFPGYGISMQDNGAWRGAFLHKNTLGRLMALATLLWIFAALIDPRWRRVSIFFVCLSLLLLVFSRSATAVLVLVWFCALLPLWFVRHWNRDLVVSATIILAVLGAGAGWWLAGNIEGVLGALGRDLSLSGRARLWTAIWENIGDRPWFGHGYAGFWLGLEGPSEEIWRRVDWMVNNAHNGILEVWLQLGIVGVGIFILSVGSNIRHGVILARYGRGIQDFFPLIYLGFIFAYNISESFLLERNSLFWILYVVVSIQLHNRTALFSASSQTSYEILVPQGSLEAGPFLGNIQKFRTTI